jgi:flavin reductase (DIM6/NTAB) family NADH-FMN oxidoreductase RutF
MRVAITESRFKEAMRRTASSVVVIAAAHDGRRAGITATAMTSVCASPPTLLVCVTRGTGLSPVIEHSVTFCVNLLTIDHLDVSNAFSGGLRGEERFQRGDWLAHDCGAPYLQDAKAAFICRTSGRYQHGTHDIIVGEVDEVLLGPDSAALVYEAGSYATTVPIHTDWPSIPLKQLLQETKCVTSTKHVPLWDW